MKMRITALSLLLLIFCAALSVSMKPTANPVVHIVVMGATNSADIGPGAITSISKFESAMTGMAKAARLEHRVYRLTGEDFNRRNILGFADGVSSRVGENDVLIVYSTCHGFRYSDMDIKVPDMWQKKYPFLAIHPTLEGDGFSRSALNESALFYGDLMQRFKGGRLKICLADACNTNLSLRTPESIFVRAATAADPERIRSLFTNWKGSAYATGCKIGQSSWTNGSNGSFLIQGFLKTLKGEIKSHEKPNWDRVLSGTVAQTESISRDVMRFDREVTLQTPQFDSFIASGIKLKD